MLFTGDNRYNIIYQFLLFKDDIYLFMYLFSLTAGRSYPYFKGNRKCYKVPCYVCFTKKMAASLFW